jgi:hypothetical protein
MLEAVESSDGFERLREFVKRLLASGLPEDVLVEDLSEIRALVPADVEDRVLDVMDLLVGWCAPEFNLRNIDKAT